ncbi:MAG: DUF4112 domain-containing protein [Terracidiphilus sp.]
MPQREPDATCTNAAPQASAVSAPPEDDAAPQRGDANPPPNGVPNFDRWNRGAWIFRDETLRNLEILLDEAFPIPGTRIRFGLDAIVGLVPGIGDVLAGLASIVFPLAGWIRGLPYITLVRMVVNLGIGVLVGSIPLLGDAFDIAWKANRRNYRLLTLHLTEPRRHTGRDWAFLLLLVAILGLVFAIPVLLVVWMIAWLLHQ